MRVLIKFPTRGRPQQFLTTLRGWLDQAADPSRIAVLVSYDTDDATMTPEIIAQAEALHPACVCVGGKSKSKIEACNADVNGHATDWDILLMVSDDVWCRRQGWDDLLRKRMAEHYPDTDGVLWNHDGTKQREVMTISCIGRKYYERERAIYHASYFSFFCDNEATDLARSRGRITFFEAGIATHEHPAWQGGMKPDALYKKNNAFWKQDEANYHHRKQLGFPP